VQQWVLLPPGVDAESAAAGSLPVMVLVHGGPQGSWCDDFTRRWNPQVFAAQGFACVMTNFTGSTGFGQAFCDGIRLDWGGQPAADVLAGLAAAAKQFPCLDMRRAVCCGASYGGYMVNWMQSFAPVGTFRCLISHAGLFDMRSFYYATDELWFPEHDFGGAYHDNPGAYERFNPAAFVSKWRTPMLITAGGKDFRVPQEQALAAFTALKRRDVPARLVVLPEASHFVSDPTQYVLWTREMIAWAADWVSTGGPTVG
jgi:dipeptidyl aminopeptidase/acylaminoacyl peptidase